MPKIPDSTDTLHEEPADDRLVDDFPHEIWRADLEAGRLYRGRLEADERGDKLAPGVLAALRQIAGGSR